MKHGYYYYCMGINFHWVQIFVVFLGFLFTKLAKFVYINCATKILVNPQNHLSSQTTKIKTFKINNPYGVIT